jgi:hypothetical protein
MTNRGWPLIRSIATLEAYIVRLKTAARRGHLPETQTVELSVQANDLRRAIGTALGIKMTEIHILMDREPLKVICSRCKCRPALKKYAYCKRCRGWNTQRYDDRIGGAQNLQKGKRRLRLLAKAA